MTEQVWAGAHAISVHVNTLDSLHLATCQQVQADLLTFDATMRTVARSLGLRVVND